MFRRGVIRGLGAEILAVSKWYSLRSYLRVTWSFSDFFLKDRVLVHVDLSSSVLLTFLVFSCRLPSYYDLVVGMS